jgi:hypothetical protein
MTIKSCAHSAAALPPRHDGCPWAWLPVDAGRILAQSILYSQRKSQSEDSAHAFGTEGYPHEMRDMMTGRPRSPKGRLPSLRARLVLSQDWLVKFDQYHFAWLPSERYLSAVNRRRLTWVVWSSS